MSMQSNTLASPRAHTPWALPLLMCAALALPAAAQSPAPAATPAPTPLVLRQGSNSPPGTVFHDHWLKFKQVLERDSKGSIKVELSTSEPNEGNLLSNLRRGRVDCTGTSLQGTATLLPEVAVLQLPYLFNNFREVDHAYGNLQGALTQTYRRLFEAKGVLMLDWVEVGFVNMYGLQPFRSPADVDGRKLRATQSRASQNWIKASGAEPVVLAFADLLPSLQTGLIKGGEAGVVIYDAVVGKAAPFYTLTQHGYDSGVILCNKEWFDTKLTAEQRKLVLTAYDSAGQRRDVRLQADKALADAAGKGITVVRLNESELRAWRAVGVRASEAVMATLGPEAVQIREALLQAIRSTPKN